MMSLQLKSMLVVAMGWLSGTQAFALDKVDGAYQIANADQLVEFATIVNNGENDANGVLTADIDMTGVAWTPPSTISSMRVRKSGLASSVSWTAAV